MTARSVHLAFQGALQTCQSHEDELGALDAVAGDGDHGLGMVRGFRAAVEATADLDGPVGDSVIVGADAFADAAGGASGAIWGVFLRAVGGHLAANGVDASVVADALAAGEARIERVGKAAVGDKTMLDTLHPFVGQLRDSVDAGAGLAEAWLAALSVAEIATEATAEMVARRGRSAVLGERGLGTVDPGARSLLLILRHTYTSLAQA